MGSSPCRLLHVVLQFLSAGAPNSCCVALALCEFLQIAFHAPPTTRPFAKWHGSCRAIPVTSSPQGHTKNGDAGARMITQLPKTSHPYTNGYATRLDLALEHSSNAPPCESISGALKRFERFFASLTTYSAPFNEHQADVINRNKWLR